jgi:hypothetical protein
MGKVGLAPTIGIGNVDLIAPAVLTYIAQQKGIDRSRVETYQVCHHQHWVFPREAGYQPGAPYFLKILIDGNDVTSEFYTDDVMIESVKLYGPGIGFTTVSASSALKNLKAMLFDENLRTHSPGPIGLPGGYPVLLNKDGAEVVLPNEITLDEAIHLNQESGKLDSIEEIKEDGTVVFTDYAFEIMKETGEEPKKIIKRKNLQQQSDPKELERIIDKILDSNKDKVEQYKSGKNKLFGFFVGQVMKVSGGKANPQLVNDILKNKLK